MKEVLIAAATLVIGTYGIHASAQEVGHAGYFEKKMPAPSDAFEIGVSGMYSQGFGDLTSGQPVNRFQDTAGPGGGAEIDLSWRLVPNLSLGVFAAGSELSNQLAVSSAQRTLAAGVQAQWFLRPYTAMNPWLSLGTAYRGFWVVPDNGDNTIRHGWEIARVQAGIDFRTINEVALGPFVGGSLDMFLTEKLPGASSYQNISGTPLAGMFQAGIMGRFDLGGNYVTESGRIVATR